MSQPKSITAAQADEGNVASGTHRQTRTRPRDDEDEEKQRTQAWLPRACLPCDAHLPTRTRGHLRAVRSERPQPCSRRQPEWTAAVRSMKPIHAEIQRDDRSWRNNLHPLPPIESIVASPLMRHVVAIHIKRARGWTPMGNASLALLAQRAPNLQSLWCKLTLTPKAARVACQDHIVKPPTG